MPLRYFKGNAQPEHHSNVVYFYHQIYLKLCTLVANCIVECFYQKNYAVVANCEHFFLKGTLGELVSQNVDQLYEFYTEFDSDTLAIQQSILAESYYSFSQGKGMGDTLHNVVDFLTKNKIAGPSYQRSCHVLGQDYSGYANSKCQL